MKQFCIYLFLIIACINCFTCFSQQHNNADFSTISFISDTQAPLFIERIIRKTNHNEKATELIYKDIIARQPSSIFILGDVVSLGYSTKKWKHIDEYLTTCKQHNIPVYAALGNHELMWHAKKGEKQFQTRFPTHSPTGYVTIVDSVAVVLVNSNFGKMKNTAVEQQDKWYAETIRQLNNEAAIKLIIVGCHHSPFTNSKVVKPNKLVQQKILPLFYSTKKCALFLSGHSHNFEHFIVQGKNFLVIGGGGGVHQPLLKQNTTLDLASSYKPMFHYLALKRTNNVLQVSSQQLKSDFSGFEEGLFFTVNSN